MKIRWIGQSGYILSDEKTTVYTHFVLDLKVYYSYNKHCEEFGKVRPFALFRGQLSRYFEVPARGCILDN